MTSFERIEDLKRLDFIVRNVQMRKPASTRILDIGCGNGIMSVYLGGLGYRVHGIDISQKAIDKARTGNKLSHVTFEVVAAERMAAPGMTYDVVVCSEVLEHLEDPHALAAAIHRLLHDDGTLIVTIPNGRGPREVLITRPMQRMQGNARLSRLVTGVKNLLGYDGATIQSAAENLQHKQFFSKASLINLLESAGFRLTRFRHADFIEAVFPYSLLTQRFRSLQRLDCILADLLPSSLASGFYTLWSKHAVLNHNVLTPRTP